MRNGLVFSVLVFAEIAMMWVEKDLPSDQLPIFTYGAAPLVLGIAGYPLFSGARRLALASSVPLAGIAAWYGVFLVGYFSFAWRKPVLSAFVFVALYHAVLVAIVCLIWMLLSKLRSRQGDHA